MATTASYRKWIVGGGTAWDPAGARQPDNARSLLKVLSNLLEGEPALAQQTTL